MKSVASRVATVLGIVLCAVGLVGTIYLVSGADAHCRYAAEAFAQMQLCSGEHANEAERPRVVPVAFFLGLCAVGLLILTRHRLPPSTGGWNPDSPRRRD